MNKCKRLHSTIHNVQRTVVHPKSLKWLKGPCTRFEVEHDQLLISPFLLPSSYEPFFLKEFLNPYLYFTVVKSFGLPCINLPVQKDASFEVFWTKNAFFSRSKFYNLVKKAFDLSIIHIFNFLLNKFVDLRVYQVSFLLIYICFFLKSPFKYIITKWY